MTSRTSPLTASSPAAARPWWQLGLAAGVIASVINAVIFVVYNAVASTPLQVVPPGGGAIQDLDLLMVVVMSVIPALFAALLAFGLSRWTRAATTWFVAISAVLAVLSLLSPIGLPAEIATGAKVTLGVMHLVVAGTVLATMVSWLSVARD